MTPSYIGIDVGTSSVKTILIDHTGRELARQHQGYSISMPEDGFVEMDPEIWYAATMECLTRMLANADASSVSAIALTGHMHTTVFLDRNMRSLRPAILWNDLRTKADIPALREAVERNGGLSHIARIIATGSPAANLFWLRHAEPAHFSKLHAFAIGFNYVAMRLTGRNVTDYSLASTSSLYDITKREWSPFMRELIGLRPEMFPKVTGSAQPVGRILPAIAGELGLQPDVSILTGAGDNPASLISTGFFTDHAPVLSLGSAGVLITARDSVDMAARGKPMLMSSDSQAFTIVVQGVLDTCGTCLQWLTGNIFQADELKSLEQAIPPHVPGQIGLMFYPHLLGDKTIYADPTLRGAILGVSTNTSRSDLVRAVLEGIGFAVRQVRDAMQIASSPSVPLKIIGGGSQSHVWLQILANILHQPVCTLADGAGPAKGAALAAAGLYFNEARTAETFLPESVMFFHYDDVYKRYLRIHDALKCITD